jgi:antitoxin (DNA-binding transcriptional repressor) of toxin-antitoxin stability system
MRVAIAEESYLPELINILARGELIVITQQGKPVALLSPLSLDPATLETAFQMAANTPRIQRRLGTATGLFTMSEDFNDPLEDFTGISKTSPVSPTP